MKMLIRYGELMLKGRNKKFFINTLNNHIRNKYKDLDVKIIRKHDHTELVFDESLRSIVEEKIMEIPGIYSYSIIVSASKEIDDVKTKALNLIDNELDLNKTYKFKVETKRSDKNFEYTSIEYSQLLAPLVLKDTKFNLEVDVRNPDVILNVIIRKNTIDLFLHRTKALGGFPATVAGKGLVMMSGGIDSPVAAFLAIKQGVETELIHFESSPLTPLESVNKVSDLAGKLAKYLPKEQIKLHVVPFYKIHEALLNNIDDSYVITIMRRMMYKIAERFANNNNIDILINGEAVGQVASQTLKSIRVVENVTNLPIIRPLATYDKEDIIKLAKYLDTFQISIKPFNDCCSIYVPKSPVINPTISRSEEEESKFDFEPLINDALNEIMTLTIKKDEVIDFSLYGFDFKDAFNNLER